MSKFIRILKRSPTLAAGLFIGLRYGLGDSLVQVHTSVAHSPLLELSTTTSSNNNNSASFLSLLDSVVRTCSRVVEAYDVERTATFGLFGMLYGAGPGNVIYNFVYPRIPFLARNPLFTAVFDVVGHCMFLYFPSFYVTKQLVQDKDKVRSGDASVVQVVQEALHQAHDNFQTDLVQMACVWVPMHYLNFRYIPLHYRVPFMGAAGVVWSIVLSCSHGGDERIENSSLVVAT